MTEYEEFTEISNKVFYGHVITEYVNKYNKRYRVQTLSVPDSYQPKLCEFIKSSGIIKERYQNYDNFYMNLDDLKKFYICLKLS